MGSPLTPMQAFCTYASLLGENCFHKLYFLEKRIENIDNGANWKEDPYLILSDSQSIH